MEQSTKEEIVKALEKAIKASKNEDVLELSQLSDETIHTASVFQDKDSIGFAVIIYALAKIVSRSQGIIDAWDKTKLHVVQELINAKKSLEADKEQNYRLILKRILRELGNLDESLHLYIQDVIGKARLVKGSKIYEHGVSMGRAAELLGISQYELMSYVGKTKIIDQYSEEVIPVTKRVDFAKKVFNI